MGRVLAASIPFVVLLALASCGSDGNGPPGGTDTGVEACTPDCIGKQCGDDGCGGSCGTCLYGQVCTNGTCFACNANCTGKQCGDDGCGGSCGTCPGGQSCANGICGQAPSCTDGLPNGIETDVDCGGNCPGCPYGKKCIQNSDCTSGLCSGGTCSSPDTCQNIAKDNLETDVDCGGTQCPGCALGKNCIVHDDCLSIYCYYGVCEVPSCGDNVQNQNETDVDCGGPCAGCIDGKGCKNGGDCAGGGCEGGHCCTVNACGYCGPAPQEVCNGKDDDCNGQTDELPECACQPNCGGKQCGDDGCDGSCGTCSPGQECEQGICKGVCTPDCYGKECGSDGCSGSCGSCGPNETCQGIQCVPTTTGTGTCKWYYSCSSECTQGDDPCFQACADALSPQGLQDTAAFQQCLENNGCYNASTDDQFYQCLDDYCLLPYYKCFSGTSYATCGQLIDCILGCQSGDDACVGNCWTEATYESQVALQNLIDCMNSACSSQCADINSQACDDCWAAEQAQGGACNSESVACSY